MPMFNQPIDLPVIIATTEDPDMVAARYGSDIWDREAQLAEIDHRWLMRTDPEYRAAIMRARLSLKELAH